MRWKMVVIEYAFVIFLHTIENVLMLIPMIYLLMKAQERHDFLEATIRPMSQETECLSRLQAIVIAASSIVGLIVPIQIILIYIFNLKGHPWSNFFKQF